MAKGPQVLESSPRNYGTNVPTNSSLTVDFNIDLDTRYIDDYVYLADSRGVHIEARVVYKKKRITVTPMASLDAGKTYTLQITGSSDLTSEIPTGIRSITNVSMAGNFALVFTTDGVAALEAPVLTSPVYGSRLRENPVFTWAAVEDAEHYELRISKSNRFDVLVFPLEDGKKFFETAVEPEIKWDEGIYYWTVRGVRDDNVNGDWSEIGQFSINLLEPGVIAIGDMPDIEVMFEEPDFEIELIEVFPKDISANVPSNIKTIYFRVIGQVDVALIDIDSFKLVGTHITGDYNETSHGEVAGQFSIVSAADGTTYLLFTIDVPEGSVS